jgi:hypothetical protein
MREEMRRLEHDLERLGTAFTYPATPQLAAAVTARITQQPRPAPALGLAGALIAAVIVAGATLAGTVAPARDAVADLFDRINIFEAEEIPEGLPTDIPGEPVTLEDAETRLGRRIELPAYPEDASDSLTKVLYQDFRPQELEAVALFFEPEGTAPFVLYETTTHVGKGLGPGATAVPVSGLGDGEAYWLRGLRVVQLYDSDGNFIRESERRTDVNTLVWQQDDFVYRLEGDLSQEEAMQIARSLE